MQETGPAINRYYPQRLTSDRNRVKHVASGKLCMVILKRNTLVCLEQDLTRTYCKPVSKTLSVIVSFLPSLLSLFTEKLNEHGLVTSLAQNNLVVFALINRVEIILLKTRPCEHGNWDTWMVLDPWNQV